MTKPCDHNVLHATGIRLQFNGIDCPYCEAERLRAALIEIQRQTYGSRWEAAVTAHAIATQALDGAVTATLAVERIAQELATRPADEPSATLVGAPCPTCHGTGVIRPMAVPDGPTTCLGIIQTGECSCGLGTGHAGKSAECRTDSRLAGDIEYCLAKINPATDIHAVLTQVMTDLRTPVKSTDDLNREPVGRCDRCGRKVWKAESLGKLDEMTQPNGTYCGGRFVAL